MDIFYKLRGGWWLIIDEIGDYDVARSASSLVMRPVHSPIFSRRNVVD